MLDEPTAALTDIEVEGLFKIMNKLTEEGKSIIFISHKMREVLHISNRITILRTGETVCTLNRGETTGEELANLMIGRELTPSQYTKVTEPEAPVIALHAVDYHKTSKHNGLNGVSLQVGRGEILGIAGVDGNGQSQLAQLVTGVIAPEGGSVDMKGSRVATFSPNGFILENVSHIPEDRNKMGLVGNMSVMENIVLKETDDPRFSDAKGWHLKKRSMRAYAEQMQQKYDIRCQSVMQESRNLSGGGGPSHPGPRYRGHPLRPRHHDRRPGQGLRGAADLRRLRRDPGDERPHHRHVRGRRHGRVPRHQSPHRPDLPGHGRQVRRQRDEQKQAL